MRQIGAFEAKNTLGSLLDAVQAGEEVVITRHGKPVARLVRETGEAEARERRRQAIEALMEHGKGLSLGDLAIRDLIDDGRKY